MNIWNIKYSKDEAKEESRNGLQSSRSTLDKFELFTELIEGKLCEHPFIVAPLKWYHIIYILIFCSLYSSHQDQDGDNRDTEASTQGSNNRRERRTGRVDIAVEQCGR